MFSSPPLLCLAGCGNRHRVGPGRPDCHPQDQGASRARRRQPAAHAHQPPRQVPWLAQGSQGKVRTRMHSVFQCTEGLTKGDRGLTEAFEIMYVTLVLMHFLRHPNFSALTTGERSVWNIELHQIFKTFFLNSTVQRFFTADFYSSYKISNRLRPGTSVKQNLTT